MAAILSAEHLSKSYTLKKLLTDVTIYIGEHDRIGVVGVNGTGKSTLLKLLSGLDEPDGGVVMSKNGLRVSYLPQMPDYSQPRTAVQQVLFDAPKDVGAPDEYEAKALLSQFGIDDFDADVRTLSGGQKKRVFLARAIAQQGQVILLDEPFTGVDVQTEARIISLLRELRDEGCTMLVSTHNLGSVSEFCDYTVMVKGTVLASGPTETTFTAENLERAFSGVLRHVALTGAEAQVITDDERPFISRRAAGGPR